MFCIVETLENGLKLISAVPKNWVTEGNILLWPNKRSEWLNGRKNCIPPGYNWQKIDCRVLLDNIGKNILRLQLFVL